MPYVPPTYLHSLHEVAGSEEHYGLPSVYFNFSKAFRKNNGAERVLQDPGTHHHSPYHIGFESHTLGTLLKIGTTEIKDLDILTDSSATSSTSDEGEDGEYEQISRCPQLVRKMSGELVRPILRPISHCRSRSMPEISSTPKIVHFNDNHNESRQFLKTDCPNAIITASILEEDIEDYTQFDEDNEDYLMLRKKELSRKRLRIQSLNLSPLVNRSSKPVYIENISFCSESTTLLGSVVVLNLAYEKFIAARFTLDNWQTTSEVSAEYDDYDKQRKSGDSDHDRFKFSIDLADQVNLESKMLLLCVRYSVNNQEHWDNNNGANFQITFEKLGRSFENLRLSERYSFFNSLSAVGSNYS